MNADKTLHKEYKKQEKRTLFCTTVGGMDPKEGANTHVVRTRGHPLGDTKVGVSVPDTRLVDAEDDKVLGCDLGDVALVCDGQGAALDVIETGGVVLGRGVAGAGIVGVVWVLDVAARGGGVPEGGSALVAGYLGGDVLASRELKDVLGVGRVAEMVVEPPLVEVEVHERGDGAVVVAKRRAADVEPEHGRVPEGCRGGSAAIAASRTRQTLMAGDEGDKEEEEGEHCGPAGEKKADGIVVCAGGFYLWNDLLL